MPSNIIVLGGYGYFGRRIVAALARESGARVFIAGRDQTKAETCAVEIGGSVEPLALDHCSADLTFRLHSVGARIVVHAAGPFQQQEYNVARACIAARCHYLDIADSRRYVTGFGELNAAAQEQNVLAVSGASSVPALSSAVIDRYREQFARIDSIECAISAGSRPPGLAAMQGVMSYIGKPFMRWQRSAWTTVYGWQDAAVYRFPGDVGRRWLVNCDVPDLELFPDRYTTVESVVFRAGVGLATTTLLVWGLSWLVRFGVIENLAPYAGTLQHLASLVEPFGTQSSAMYVRVVGLDRERNAASKTWALAARNNQGPKVPCAPAIALAKKIVRGQVSVRGAMPCIGILNLDEILSELADLNLQIDETT